LKTLDAVNPRGRSGYPQYLTLLGFEWFPCTDIVHFSADELPQGRIVVQIKEHLAAVITRRAARHLRLLAEEHCPH
jgi:hypothetical protein